MNGKQSQIIEQINAIKLKLNKYTNLKLYDKVNEYLQNLSRFNLNEDILTRTDIMNCLRDLRNNPTLTSKVNDLIRKFKTDALKTTNIKPDGQVAPSANKSVVANSKPAIGSKPNEVNKASNSKNLSSSSSASSLSNRKSTTVIEIKAQSNKKRLINEKPKFQEDENISKKPKLSLTDYKLLKGNNPESKSNDSRGSSSSGSSSQYEIEYDPNLVDSYSPTPRNGLSKSKTQQIIMPPVPSVPLDKIIINEPYEQINSVNTSTGNSMIGSKNSQISKYSSLLSNPTSKAVNSLVNDDEELSQIMKQKGQQKQILYTGKRNLHGNSTQVPKLFDLSVRVLIEHLDDLPNKISIYNTINDFPIAFGLIKPVLERANAKQLENCENYSPNLLDDSDYIWKKICEREFRKLEPPEEDESWRELYFKKLDEREEEFQRARKLISSKQQAKPKERQTQLATVKFVSANRSVKQKITTSDSSGPVRTMIPLDSGSSFKRSSNSNSRFGPPQPAMSQGRKAIMKMIKKSTSRR